MPPQKTLNERVDEFNRDLDQIENMLELLRREYDLYFAGTRKRQPYEMRTQVERLIRKWRTSTIQKIELQFRLNTMSSKYQAMADVWEKILKRREVDPKALSPFGPSSAHLAEEMARLNRDKEKLLDPASAGAAAAAGARERAGQASADPEARVKTLFDQFLDAKKDMGETVDSLSYAKFKAQIEKQVDQIRQKTNCRDVEFGVVRKEGKVSLTAKPIK